MHAEYRTLLIHVDELLYMLKSCAFQFWLPKKYEVQLVANNMMIVSHLAKYEYICYRDHYVYKMQCVNCP